MKEKKFWALGDKYCKAHTKSEARAEFKRMLGISKSGRLPKGSFVALVK